MSKRGGKDKRQNKFKDKISVKRQKTKLKRQNKRKKTKDKI